jgi:hypothetical protein
VSFCGLAFCLNVNLLNVILRSVVLFAFHFSSE